MEMLGKVLLAALLLMVLFKLVDKGVEKYTQYGAGGDNLKEETMKQMAPPMTQPPMTQPPMTQPPMTQPPMTQPPMTQPPMTQPPMTQPPMTQPPMTSEQELPEQGTPEEVFGTLGGFENAAPVPKCENALCQGCLLCETTKASSCGYATDDKQADRNYVGLIQKIRSDRGEDWNMNYKIDSK